MKPTYTRTRPQRPQRTSGRDVDANVLDHPVRGGHQIRRHHVIHQAFRQQAVAHAAADELAGKAVGLLRPRHPRVRRRCPLALDTETGSAVANNQISGQVQPSGARVGR